jgi:hypothetical protein
MLHNLTPEPSWNGCSTRCKGVKGALGPHPLGISQQVLTLPLQRTHWKAYALDQHAKAHAGKSYPLQGGKISQAGSQADAEVFSTNPSTYCSICLRISPWKLRVLALLDYSSVQWHGNYEYDMVLLG